MADVVKLVFGSAYEGGGVRQFVAGAESATKAAMRTTGAARTLTSALAKTGGTAGGAVGDVARLVTSFTQLGAVGGIIAGVQIALDRLCEGIKKAADTAAEATIKMADKMREKLDKLNEQRMEGVNKALDEATTKAKSAASAFDALASAYMKVSAAQDAVAKSGASAAVSGMELEKAKAMSAAGNDGDRALVGAGWDVKIARQRAADVGFEQDRAVAAAEDNAQIRRKQAKDAEKAEAKALRAKELAAKIYEEDVNGDNQRNVEKSKAALAEAEKAYAEAVNTRVSKVADAEAAEAHVTEAQNNRTTAINGATRAVVQAEEAERRLVQAQIDAEKAELERARAVKKEVAAKPKPSDDGSLQLLKGARGDFASRFEQAFELWRDPEAAKAAQDEEKSRAADMKRFRKDVSRYGGKWKIDEYAELMRQGDTEGMQEKLAEWRKSSKFTPQVEQMVKAAAAEQNENAAERALQNIEKNTADLAKKLDELLSVK